MHVLYVQVCSSGYSSFFFLNLVLDIYVLLFLSDDDGSFVGKFCIFWCSPSYEKAFYEVVLSSY